MAKHKHAIILAVVRELIAKVANTPTRSLTRDNTLSVPKKSGQAKGKKTGIPSFRIPNEKKIREKKEKMVGKSIRTKSSHPECRIRTPKLPKKSLYLIEDLMQDSMTTGGKKNHRPKTVKRMPPCLAQR
ncbi:hypothetical protein KBC03_05385 [Patescibacteria group bacterium]|nr:hypothetical protein [Patescibacteria group bacterium]